MADDNKPQCSGGTDYLTLLAGLATLFAAAYVLTDGRIWVPTLDLRWMIAGGAVLAGLLFLALSLRRKKD